LNISVSQDVSRKFKRRGPAALQRQLDEGQGVEEEARLELGGRDVDVRRFSS